MKKLFWGFAIVVTAMVTMTSCEKKEHCWKGEINLSVKWDNNEEIQNYEFFTWGTEEEVSSALESYINTSKEYFDIMGGGETETSISYTIKKYKAAELDCKNAENYSAYEDWLIAIDEFREIE
ncbi:MAG: hypothetical protein J6P95_05370 [Paludibacteraceae bacterium]|nr:hypothetical protein [Paludibacteraceae bacterium]